MDISFFRDRLNFVVVTSYIKKDSVEAKPATSKIVLINGYIYSGTGLLSGVASIVLYSGVALDDWTN